MFRPFYFFIGQRYTIVKRKNHFISFISIVSVLGIALGVAVLITVMSVMNGFSKEIRAQMLSTTPHIIIQSNGQVLYQNTSLIRDLMKNNKVEGAAKYIWGQGMISIASRNSGVMLNGIEPNATNNVFPLESKMVKGSVSSLTRRSFGIILGQELANVLGVRLGDKVTVVTAKGVTTPAGVQPRFKRFVVKGIYDTGSPYDRSFAYVNIDDAAIFFQMGNEISGIQLKLKDALNSKEVKRELQDKFKYKYSVNDWTDQHSNFFEAIKMEKTVMFIILLLIVAVAAFNLISSLVMMVTDKRSDIAILRTMGASSKAIMGIFMVQGTIIGFVGTALGLIFGLLLAFNVTGLVNWLQKLLNTQFISQEVYFINYVPSDVHKADVIGICVAALIISFFATIYPALKGASIKPAEGLRYE